MTDREQLRADIKRQLRRYRELKEERKQIAGELGRLEAVATSPSSPNLDGMPRGPGAGNPVERMALRVCELEDKYKELMAALLAAQLEIENMIGGLASAERRLARLRYIEGLTWEDISEILNYSYSQTHRYHRAMLEHLVEAEIERRNVKK